MKKLMYKPISLVASVRPGACRVKAPILLATAAVTARARRKRTRALLSRWSSSRAARPAV